MPNLRFRQRKAELKSECDWSRQICGSRLASNLSQQCTVEKDSIPTREINPIFYFLSPTSEMRWVKDSVYSLATGWPVAENQQFSRCLPKWLQKMGPSVQASLFPRLLRQKGAQKHLPHACPPTRMPVFPIPKSNRWGNEEGPSVARGSLISQLQDILSHRPSLLGEYFFPLIVLSLRSPLPLHRLFLPSPPSPFLVRSAYLWLHPTTSPSCSCST